MLVPAPDEIASPFARDHIGKSRRGGLWQRPQGVAVQVDDVLRKSEAVAQVRQRIACVQGSAILTGHTHRATSSCPNLVCPAVTFQLPGLSLFVSAHHKLLLFEDRHSVPWANSASFCSFSIL